MNWNFRWLINKVTKNFQKFQGSLLYHTLINSIVSLQFDSFSFFQKRNGYMKIKLIILLEIEKKKSFADWWNYFILNWDFSFSCIAIIWFLFHSFKEENVNKKIKSLLFIARNRKEENILLIHEIIYPKSVLFHVRLLWSYQFHL